jgi:hypothetical protein
LVSPVSLRGADAVLGAGAAAMPQLEVGELTAWAAGAGVGGEGGVAQAVRVGDPQLRARVRTFAAHDHPHPGWPGGQVHQAGGLDDPGSRTRFAVGVQGGLPVRGREGGELVDQCLGQAEPDRVGQPLPVEPAEELVRGAGTVDPDQDLATGPVAALVSWQLTQRGPDHGDVVGSGVRPGVARAQQRGERLSGPGRAVVDERPQRVVAEALLERRCRTLLVGVGGHQGGVHVDDQWVRRVGVVIGSRVCGRCPGPGSCRTAGGVDRRQHRSSVGGEAVDRPRTVGSEATDPNRAGSARSNAMSARQSPPTASASAKSSSTFAGSCTASRSRHGSNPLDSARSSPTLAMVSVSSLVPAWDTTVVAAVSMSGHG